MRCIFKVLILLSVVVLSACNPQIVGSGGGKAPDPADVCSGKTINGIVGTANCSGGGSSGVTLSPLSPAADASHILAGKKAYDDQGSAITGSMNDNATWSMAAAFPSAGYFAGISNAPTSSQVCAPSGSATVGPATFLGAAGTAVCLGSGATSDATLAPKVLSGTSLYDSTGHVVAGSISTSSPTQSSVVAGSENDDSVTSVNVTPTAGNLFSGFTVSLGAQFQKANICSGKTIFGRAGTALCNAVFGDLTASQAYRQDNATIDLTDGTQVAARVQATLSDEVAGNATFTTNSKLVPDPQYDTDGRYSDTGLSGEKRNYLVTVKGGRPDKVCGLSGTTQARVDDCASQNPVKGIYEGKKYGQGGEGDWKLVTLYSAAYCSNASYHNETDCTGNGGAWTPAGTTGDTCSGGRAAGCYEVWRDERTKQIWSDTMMNEWNGYSGYNWFQAAGYSSSADTTAKTGYQGQAGVGTDCYDMNWQQNQQCQPATPISVCADATAISDPAISGGLNGVPLYINPDGNNGTTDERPKKGGMDGATHKWRLPTIEDWQQANIDGVRKVLPNMDYPFWSASSVSGGRNYAWYFGGNDGYVGGSGRGGPGVVVACVGL